jgi:hypothetical protein
VASHDPNYTEAAALPEDDAALPPVLARLGMHGPYHALAWSNSDYVLGARVLQVSGQIPDDLSTFRAGRHEIMTVEVDLGLSADDIRRRAAAREAERTIKTGRFTAVFDHGKVRCGWDGKELTSFLHFYASLLIGGMWNDSPAWQWNAPEREGCCLAVTGESRRFPFAQRWELEPAENGLAVRIWLDVYEPMDIEEYHASLVLRTEYDRWKTEPEVGEYPRIDPAQKDWRHANRVYATGKFAQALSSTLPSVIFNVTTDEAAFRMTAVNTGYYENARVLQALRTPEGGLLRFGKGRHMYFAGLITVAGGETREGSRPSLIHEELS